MNTNKKNVVTETYESLSDYMTKNGYPVVALLDENGNTNNDELYGIKETDVNYTLNIIGI